MKLPPLRPPLGPPLRGTALAVLALAAAGSLGACGGKKKAGSASTGDGGAATGSGVHATGPADVGRCVATLERAAAMPATERAGTIVRGCAVCGRPFDAVLAADRADTGGPVDLEEIWAVVHACGGVCTNQAAASFRNQLTELTPGRPSTRPWRALAGPCGEQLHLDTAGERFASGAWYAFAVIGDKLAAARATMPPTEQARLDGALASMLLPLPPLSAPGTGFVVPGGGLLPGTPWLQITVTADATFLGRLAFARLAPSGIELADGGVPYPGDKLKTPSELADAISRWRDPTTLPPPALTDRIDEPVVIAPRASPARTVIDVMRALGPHQARLAVATAAPAALWRGLVAAHPVLLGATAPVGRRLRLGLSTPRIAVVDDKGAVLVSAELPFQDRLLVERWVGALNAVGAEHTVEVLAEDGKVDAMAALLDAAAGAAVRLAVPAPVGAKLTGHDLPTFDEAAIKAALGAP
jgi:hypothetical protein